MHYCVYILERVMTGAKTNCRTLDMAHHAMEISTLIQDS
jgi:hypothetical protein